VPQRSWRPTKAVLSACMRARFDKATLAVFKVGGRRVRLSTSGPKRRPIPFSRRRVRAMMLSLGVFSNTEALGTAGAHRDMRAGHSLGRAPSTPIRYTAHILLPASG
jgi:hypothetical protein